MYSAVTYLHPLMTFLSLFFFVTSWDITEIQISKIEKLETLEVIRKEKKQCTALQIISFYFSSRSKYNCILQTFVHHLLNLVVHYNTHRCVHAIGTYLK